MHSKATAFSQASREQVIRHAPNTKVAHERVQPLLEHIRLTKVVGNDAQRRFTIEATASRSVIVEMSSPDYAHVDACLCERLYEGIVVDAVTSHDCIDATVRTP